MVVGLTLDGCGVEEGEGCDRHDDRATAVAVSGGGAAEVVLGGNGGDSVAVEVEVTLDGCDDGLVEAEAEAYDGHGGYAVVVMTTAPAMVLVVGEH